jgi:hypothetical protein
MAEPIDSPSGRRRLLLVLGAVVAALAIGGVVAVAVVDDDDDEPAAEDVGGDTGEDSTGPKVLDSQNPVREAREEGIPVIKITPKQARQGFDSPRELKRLLEKQSK